MARFSVGGEEDGEGPSDRVHKRPRTVLRAPPSSFIPLEERQQEAQEEEDGDADEYDDDEGEEDGEEEDEAESEEEEDEEERVESEDEPLIERRERNSGHRHLHSGNSRDGVGSSKDGPISVTLLDPEVLDCCICCEPLTIPIFQCENGHIACSSCCTKLRNKCPSCSLPIGYNRCRAMEKVLGSVRVPCQNGKYGCKEMFSYSTKCIHEKKCIYIPCSCPFSGCNFVGSSKQLYEHFSGKHKNSQISFLFDSVLPVTLKANDKFLVLQEDRDGLLFILNNSAESLGNMVTISCIGPPVPGMGEYLFEILVKAQGSSVRFQSSTLSIQKRVEAPPSKSYLVIPYFFFDYGEQVKLEICIQRNGFSSAIIQRNSVLVPW